jgi:hypothetical protein
LTVKGNLEVKLFSRHSKILVGYLIAYLDVLLGGPSVYQHVLLLYLDDCLDTQSESFGIGGFVPFVATYCARSSSDALTTTGEWQAGKVRTAALSSRSLQNSLIQLDRSLNRNSALNLSPQATGSVTVCCSAKKLTPTARELAVESQARVGDRRGTLLFSSVFENYDARNSSTFAMNDPMFCLSVRIGDFGAGPCSRGL